MVVTDITSSSDSDILQQSFPCCIDHQVAYLVLVSSTGKAPGELVNFMMWEECPSDEWIVCHAEFK